MLEIPPKSIPTQIATAPDMFANDNDRVPSRASRRMAGRVAQGESTPFTRDTQFDLCPNNSKWLTSGSKNSLGKCGQNRARKCTSIRAKSVQFVRLLFRSNPSMDSAPDSAPKIDRLGQVEGVPDKKGARGAQGSQAQAHELTRRPEAKGVCVLGLG